MKKVRKTFQNKESLERPIYKASQAFCLFQLSKTGLYHGISKNKIDHCCGLFCSKGVLGLEINEVIRGITTIEL